MYQGRGSRGRDQVLRKFPGPVRRHVWKPTQVATWAMKRMRGDCVEPGLKKGGVLKLSVLVIPRRNNASRGRSNGGQGRLSKADAIGTLWWFMK